MIGATGGFRSVLGASGNGATIPAVPSSHATIAVSRPVSVE